MSNVTPDIHKRVSAAVAANRPLMTFWDKFDIFLRILVLVFIYLHHQHYYSYGLTTEDDGSGNETADSRGKFEDSMYKVLRVPW